MMKSMVVGPRTGQQLPKGEIGQIINYEMNEENQKIVVKTEYFGYETDDGIEIVEKGSDINSFFSLHGQPCSTVADQMMAHGQPCSTVADQMMAHGQPCSTVADQMMK
jgi:anaerobic magnesium-protoporphyrin IX monomethyl ester cyclase